MTFAITDLYSATDIPLRPNGSSCFIQPISYTESVMSDDVPPDMVYWYRGKDHTKRGPIGPDGLGDAIAKQEITVDTLVWCKGMTAWVRADETPLSACFDAPPPLPEEALAARKEIIPLFAPSLTPPLAQKLGQIAADPAKHPVAPKRSLITKQTWFCFGAVAVFGVINSVLTRTGVPEAIGSALGLLIFGGGIGLFLKLIFSRKTPNSDSWILWSIIITGAGILLPLLLKF